MRFKICSTVFTIMIFSAFLCSCENNPSAPAGMHNSVNSSVCSHDLSTYTEPTVTEGRYYLNGNIDRYYFEVKGVTIQLMNADLPVMYDSWQNDDNFYNTEDKELLEKRLNAKQEWIDEMSFPREFTVTTMHNTTDEVVLVTKTTVTPDGFIVSEGMVLKDSITLSGFGTEGDFILVPHIK